jgi:hypothetical protein
LRRRRPAVRVTVWSASPEEAGSVLHTMQLAFDECRGRLNPTTRRRGSLLRAAFRSWGRESVWSR